MSARRPAVLILLLLTAPAGLLAIAAAEPGDPSDDRHCDEIEGDVPLPPGTLPPDIRRLTIGQIVEACISIHKEIVFARDQAAQYLCTNAQASDPRDMIYVCGDAAPP